MKLLFEVSGRLTSGETIDNLIEVVGDSGSCEIIMLLVLHFTILIILIFILSWYDLIALLQLSFSFVTTFHLTALTILVMCVLFSFRRANAHLSVINCM
jgi:hypothetical protein